jgi:hypothetical protein
MTHALRAACLLAAILVSGPAATQPADLPTPLLARLDALRADCAGFEGGALTLGEDAISRPDLNGDGNADWALDTHAMTCSSAASLFCGTGGCSVSFMVGDVLTERLAKGWRLVQFGPFPTLLLQVHGTNCGGTNQNTCIEALVWDEAAQRFNTVAPPQQ